MAPFFKRSAPSKSKDNSLPSGKSRRGRNPKDEGNFFETSQVVETGLFFAFFLLVTLICFLGQTPQGPAMIPNHPAPGRIVAEFPFGYESAILAERRMNEVRAQVPPIFKRSFEPFDEFRTLINDLNASFAKSQIEHEEEGQEAVNQAYRETTAELIARTPFEISPESIVDFAKEASPKKRSDLLNDALGILRGLYEEGIYSPQTGNVRTGPQVSVIQMVDEEGKASLPDARSLDEAGVSLRVRINALSSDSATAQSLYDIFRAGLRPNLLYSQQATERAIQRAEEGVDAPVITFKEGETIIEPGTRIGELEIERMNAYTAAENEMGRGTLFLNEVFIHRVVLTFSLLVAILIYLKQGLREIHKRNRAIAITAVAILLNLFIIRLVMELGGLVLLNSQGASQILPFAAPYALAPIIVAVLVGPGPAVLSTLIISILFGIMQDNSMEFLLAAFVSGIVGSYVSTNIRKRSKLVRAGLICGGIGALAAVIIGLLQHMSFALVGQQIITAFVIGLFTGILAVGLIPVFEHIFKITTEITLLELTDFNHPLLRRMQIEAPGTYHHSLMVANLSENAAAAIGASPLLCRVCSFFHDIGKLVKPEYFVENQRDGINPHQEKNPSMSALVIKAHVKEGVELARKNKLPRVIIDVIRQHHGTGLIQYFYFEAQKRRKSETQPPFAVSNGGSQDNAKVDESTYRYDGPKPAFKESAIIFFADSVEAASRSLKKVTQPAIEELIDALFKDRIEDGQLDECPLTFKELDLIRKSFIFTLLNMLHSRVEYPKEKNKEEKLPKIAGGGESPDSSQQESDEPNKPGNQQPV